MTAGKKAPEHKGIDWKRVKHEAAQDTTSALDPTTAPYNANNPVAVATYWTEDTVKPGRAGRPASMAVV